MVELLEYLRSNRGDPTFRKNTSAASTWLASWLASYHVSRNLCTVLLSSSFTNRNVITFICRVAHERERTPQCTWNAGVGRFIFLISFAQRLRIHPILSSKCCLLTSLNSSVRLRGYPVWCLVRCTLVLAGVRTL